MPVISLDLEPAQVMPQIGTFYLVQEVRRRLSRVNYIPADLLDGLEEVEDSLRIAYAEASLEME